MNHGTLDSLRDPGSLTADLRLAGFGEAAARDKAMLLHRAAEVLARHGAAPSAPVIACYVPGRIEVLGKHADYAGGRSLLVATERGFCAVAVPNDNPAVSVFDAGDGRQCQFTLAEPCPVRTGDWSNYPMTVAQRIARNFPGNPRGATIAFASDLPRAAGMSSSSALMVTTFLVLATVNHLAERDEFLDQIHGPEDLAGYLGTIENGQDFGRLTGDRGVGTFGGSEDHTAMICSEPNRIGQFAYCPVRRERSIPMPADHVFLIASSGIAAEKTGAAMARYNRASLLATEAARLWRQATGRDDPHLAAAIASAPDACARIRVCLRESHHPRFSPQELLDRFEQFVAASEEIVLAVPDRWDGPALARFGDLADRSQQLATDLLGNQVPETVFLASSARELGAVAASAFGAGFGGSVWALVRREDADTLRRRWQERYTVAHPAAALHAAFFATHAGPAALPVALPADARWPIP